MDLYLRMNDGDCFSAPINEAIEAFRDIDNGYRITIPIGDFEFVIRRTDKLILDSLQELDIIIPTQKSFNCDVTIRPRNVGEK